jgi:hypothetical protein
MKKLRPHKENRQYLAVFSSPRRDKNTKRTSALIRKPALIALNCHSPLRKPKGVQQ